MFRRFIAPGVESRRDGAIVAIDALSLAHGGLAQSAWNWTFAESLNMDGGRVFGPPGQESIAQGLPLVLVYKPEAPKGAL